MHKVETNIYDDRYRPGFAKRIEDPTVCSRTIAPNLTAYEVQQAIALGLSHLTAQERDLLQFYTAFLNLTHVKDGKTSVWPSSRLACNLLGISAATLRRYKASLEHKGYLLRRYDRRNRPLEQGAIDLAPLLMQVKELLKHVQKQHEAQRAYYHTLSAESSEGSRDQMLTANPLNVEHHKHINSKNSFSVPKVTTSEEAGIGDRDRLTNRPETVLDMQAVRTVIENSITLGSYFVELDWSKLKSDELWDLLDRSVRQFYPEGERAAQAWSRAKNRLGAQAIELLIVSLDDPKIKGGARFLGFMAYKWQVDLNLGPNLKRVTECKRQSEVHREDQDQSKQLRQKHSIFRNTALSDSILRSWFGKSEVEEEADRITVWVENEFVKSRILADYLPVLQRGCGKKIQVCLG